MRRLLRPSASSKCIESTLPKFQVAPGQKPLWAASSKNARSKAPVGLKKPLSRSRSKGGLSGGASRPRSLRSPVVSRSNARIAAGEERSGAVSASRSSRRLSSQAHAFLNAGRSEALSSAASAAVRPEKGDGLRVVHTSAGAVVYERASALPRIRWAGTSEVIPDGPTRVRRLTEGVAPGTVLLDDSSTPAATGSAAQVDVRRDEPETISASVTADGAGYLVVADSIARPGWSATVELRRSAPAAIGKDTVTGASATVTFLKAVA